MYLQVNWKRWIAGKHLHIHPTCFLSSQTPKQRPKPISSRTFWIWQLAGPERSSCHCSTPETYLSTRAPSLVRKLFSVFTDLHSFSSLLRLLSTIISASCCRACLYSQSCPPGTERRPQGQHSSLEPVLTITKSKTMENSQSIFCFAVSCRIGC